MTIDHTGIWIHASNHAAVVRWYEAALQPLGYKKFITEGPNEEVVGFSDTGIHADWWLLSSPDAPSDAHRTHHAFISKDRAAVDAFYNGAMKAGGKDNGPPGLRPQYHDDYYAAFVLDPAGNNIEVVCHQPQPQ